METDSNDIQLRTAAKAFYDAVSQIDFSDIPGGYDAVPFAQLESAMQTTSTAIVQTSNLETLYDLTVNLTADLTAGVISQDRMPDSRDRFSTVIAWANEFNRIHAGREWDGEYLETVDDFYAEKTKDIRNAAPAITGYASYGRYDHRDEWVLIAHGLDQSDVSQRGGKWQDDNFDTVTRKGPEMLWVNSDAPGLEMLRETGGDTFPGSLPADF